MIKNVLLFFVFIITSKVFLGQSVSNAYISANIVSSIGTEKPTDFEFRNIMPGSNPAILNLKPAVDHSNISILSQNNTHQKSGTASLKIMNGNYSFGILLESVPFFVTHQNGNEIIRVGCVNATTTKHDALENHYAVLSLGATLNMDPGNSAGVYTADKPLNVIVAFE